MDLGQIPKVESGLTLANRIQLVWLGLFLWLGLLPA